MLLNTKHFNLIRFVISIVLLPVILAYKVAYRLVGIPTTYTWGDIDVKPTTPVTEGQFLFSRIFPMVVLIIIFLVIWWLGGGLS